MAEREAIPLRPVGVEPAHQHVATYEAPYRWFIAASLTLGIGGGFMLAMLLPLARAFEWQWGAGVRSQALVEAHGQLQLIGFGGLFVMGMALRLMPRFSGRPLAYHALVPWLIPAVASSLILRSVAQPWGDGALRGGGLIVSAVLLLAAAGAFAAIVWRTLAHRDSRADATGYFLMLGALGYVAGAVLNLLQVIEMARDGLPFAPVSKQTAQTFAQLYGFLLMFVSGIGLRAVPTFTGVPRRWNVLRVAALALACGVALFVGAMLWIAYRSSSSTTVARVGDAGLLLTAAVFAVLVWLTGALWPSKNRVAAASQTAFWFVRSAFAWMLVAAVLTAWYAIRALADGGMPDSFEIDAIRHTLTVGVVVMMIVGMATLIVPEFAGRRLQHPDERWLLRVMIVSLNVAVALRLWPAIEGINWLANTRYWPMAAAGGLASGVVIVFAAMFAQSYVEQRRPGWGSAGSLAAQRSRKDEAAP